jgi:hypothetical protein
VDFIAPVPGSVYAVHSFEGGHGDASVPMIKKAPSYDMLNRRIVMLHHEKQFMQARRTSIRADPTDQKSTEARRWQFSQTPAAIIAGRIPSHARTI